MTASEVKEVLALLEAGNPIYVEHETKRGIRRALGVYSSYNEYNLFLNVGWEDDARVAAGHIALSHITEIRNVSRGRHLLYKKVA